jgi:hypothetical protein
MDKGTRAFSLYFAPRRACAACAGREDGGAAVNFVWTRIRIAAFPLASLAHVAVNAFSPPLLPWRSSITHHAPCDSLRRQQAPLAISHAGLIHVAIIELNAFCLP